MINALLLYLIFVSLCGPVIFLSILPWIPIVSALMEQYLCLFSSNSVVVSSSSLSVISKGAYLFRTSMPWAFVCLGFGCVCVESSNPSCALLVDACGSGVCVLCVCVCVCLTFALFSVYAWMFLM